MVFFTSILIVIILYYFQADGIVYVTIIALVAELINIFMTHTVTKSVEKKLTAQHRRVMSGFAKRLTANRNRIKEFENAQEASVKILYKANMKIKELEEKLGQSQTPQEERKEGDLPAKPSIPQGKAEIEKARTFIDLPDGSNRNRP